MDIKKFLLLTFLSVILLGFSFSDVSAVLVNKPLNISVANCYSVNISVNLEMGRETDLRFVGCDKINNNAFNCRCLNSANNNFSLIMQSDNAIVRDLRDYDIYVSANYFDVKRKTMSVIVTDGGDYYEVSAKDWVERNQAKYVEKLVYVNQTINNTIFQDRIVYVPEIRNVTIEHNNTLYVNVTQFVENTTRVNQALQSKYNWRIISGILGFLHLILIGIFFYFLLFGFRKQNKKEIQISKI